MSKGYRLSPQQANHWQQLASRPCHAEALIALREAVELPRLDLALRALVTRHEILRTRYRSMSGKDLPVQSIAAAPDHAAYALREVPIAKPLDRPALAERLRALAVATPRDLADGPVLRLWLAHDATGGSLLLLDLPALAADAGSMALLTAELAELYREGGALTAPTSLQYADVAEWLNGLLEVEDEDGDLGRQHWLGLDLVDLASQRLPFGRHVADWTTFDPRSLEAPLAVERGSALDSLAASCGVSLADCCLAVWLIMIGRLLGQERVGVGLACDGRTYDDLVPAIGLLTRVVPVFTTIDGRATFRGLLASVAEAASAAAGWQEYFSWAPIARALEHSIGAFFCPLVFEPLSSSGIAPDSSWELLSVNAVTERFWLKLTADTTRGILRLSYDGTRIDDRDAERLLAQVQTLLSSALAAPDGTLSGLSMLTEAERRELLVDRHAERDADWSAEGLEDQVEAWAKVAPEAAAVLGPDGELSYQELCRSAGALAARLLERKLGAEDRVGLAVGRTTAFAVGVLGILRAGCTFVPIDPEYPRERLASLLADSRLQLLVGERRALDLLPAHQVQTFELAPGGTTDGSGDGYGDGLKERLPVAASPQAGAYLIFTSGSTGKPRGVVISRGSLNHYARAIAPRLGLAAGSRYLHTASVAFSSAVRQLLVPLTCGATVVMASEEERRDPLALLARVRAAQVTHLDLVPSAWRSLCQALAGFESQDRAELIGGSVRRLASASEPLLDDLPRRWRHEFGHPAELLNMFGQTETTGIVATDAISVEATGAVLGVPIGRPLAGIELHLLDDELRPSPIGVAARVAIGGRTLGRGYFERPRETAERFIPNPLAAEPGERLYLTGDLARFRPDGRIDFLGRQDHQVKIRGLRVELGEIEAAIRSLHEVSEVVVMPYAEGGDDARLVAYYVPSQSEAPSTSALGGLLRERLPAAMVPAHWVALSALPLGPNGKVNRRALPAPSFTREGAGGEYVAPRDATEEQLASLWATLLKVERVGVFDSFFRLGGHSLLATVLMSRLRDQFGVQLPVLRIFEDPTIAGLARAIAAARVESVPAEAVPSLTATLVPEAVDQLSDDEVSALLAEMLAEQGAR